MGHGCHDCGCPNGCECPGSHGDWYKQRYELKTTTLDFTDWHHQYWLAKSNERQSKHIMAIATVAASLPVDPEADRKMASLLKKNAVATTGRKLISMSDVKERVRLIRLSLHADDAERATVMIDDLAFRMGIL